MLVKWVIISQGIIIKLSKTISESMTLKGVVDVGIVNIGGIPLKWHPPRQIPIIHFLEFYYLMYLNLVYSYATVDTLLW